MPSHYCFVDAGALRGYIDNISRRFHAGKVFEIDFTRLVSIFNFTKMFYYDALPVREQGETEIAYEARIADQKAVLNRASATNRVHVYEGDARRRRKVGLQQKKVDVMLAVDMLTHTFRGNMEMATLITGDNDFKPLIDAVIHEGMYVQLIYPFGETSQELIDAADERYPITTGTLHSMMTDASRADFDIPKSQTFLHGHEPPVTIEQTWETAAPQPESNSSGIRFDEETGQFFYQWEGRNVGTISRDAIDAINAHREASMLSLLAGMATDYIGYWSHATQAENTVWELRQKQERDAVIRCARIILTGSQADASAVEHYVDEKQGLSGVDTSPIEHITQLPHDFAMAIIDALKPEPSLGELIQQYDDAVVVYKALNGKEWEEAVDRAADLAEAVIN